MNKNQEKQSKEKEVNKSEIKKSGKVAVMEKKPEKIVAVESSKENSSKEKKDMTTADITNNYAAANNNSVTLNNANTKPENKKSLPNLPEETIRKVEAILFASSKRMTKDEIAAVLPEIPPKDVEIALKQLKINFENLNLSIYLEFNENAWKLSLKKEYLPLAEKLMPSTELPRPVIETLAILAWKAPILQAELVHLRSASAYDHIGELEKIGLIKRTRQGRSFVIDLTEKFYDYFDLPKTSVQQLLEGYEDPVAEVRKEEGVKETDEQRKDRLIAEIRKNKINPEDIIAKDKEYLQNFDSRLKSIEGETKVISDEVQKGKQEMDADLAKKAGMPVEESVEGIKADEQAAEVNEAELESKAIDLNDEQDAMEEDKAEANSDSNAEKKES
jgi:segregation and condensation protein B